MLGLKRWILPLKIILTLSLFYFIFQNVNWLEVQVVWEQADIWLVSVLILVKLFGSLIGAVRWKILLQIQNQWIFLRKLYNYYLVGRFFSYFLPTMIGGDTYRIYKLSKAMNNLKHPLLSVIADRVFGFLILLSFGFVSVILSWKEWNEISAAGLVISTPGTLLFVVLIGLLCFSSLRENIIGMGGLPQRARQMIEDASVYLQNKRLFSLYLCSVVLFYVIMILGYQVTFAMFNVEIPILTLIITIMLTRTVAMIPISLNGFGLLDGSFVYLISQTGVAYEIAVLVMLLQRIIETGISMMGGMLYMCDSKQPNF